MRSTTARTAAAALSVLAVLFTPTTATAHPASSPGDTIALPVRDALAALPVQTESRTRYERTKFRHWTDADRDGCRTRNEVLLEEAVTAPEQDVSCRLTGGSWYWARAGHAVIVSGRRKEAGEAVTRDIRDNGGQAAFIAADVNTEEGVAALITATVERFSRLDVAVNNAGVSLDTGRLADEPTSHFQQMLTTNVLGVFWGMKYQIQHMLAQENPGGAIINLASIAGLGGIRYAANYSTTKHAVVGLTKSAALEYATDHIRINGVAPTAIKTDILSTAIDAGTWDEATIAALQPVNRMGRPTEVADAITWLASPQASFVTGTILNVDGGYKAQ